MEAFEAYQMLGLLNKKLLSPKISLIDENFPKQAAFLRDTSSMVAAFCPRRAGKSSAIGRWLLEPILKEPEVTTLYIALTYSSAKDIMWRDVLKTLNREYDLNLKTNETELTVMNPKNGSMLKLAGANAGPEEMKKFLGRKIRRVAIDEAADFRQDLEMLVYEILMPALADLDGEIALIGTPGTIAKGLFFNITTRGRPGWSVHKWATLDNPYMKEPISKQINKLKEDNPRVEETPWFKRNYLGEWVIDDGQRCYKYSPEHNGVTSALDPEFFVLGVDLGFNDASAFVIAGYSATDKNLYFIDCYKSSKMTLTEVAERIHYYQNKYRINRMVVDNASKQAVEELKQRFGLPLEAAEKHGKAEFIEIMNSEMIIGKIKYLIPAMKDLIDEYADLVWDHEAKKKQEHPACENHLADAALYAWRFCYNYLSQPLLTVPKKTDQEIIDEWEERQLEELEEEESPRNKAWWDH